MFYARTRLGGSVWDWHRADGHGGLICFAPGGALASYQGLTVSVTALLVQSIP